VARHLLPAGHPPGEYDAEAAPGVTGAGAAGVTGAAATAPGGEE
jgi:hypothetical protein